MDSLKHPRSLSYFFCLMVLIGSTLGCQIPYLVKSSYNQLSLLSSRQDIDKALQDPKVSDEEKRKLRLSQKVREFAMNQLHLKESKNYTSFVKLDRASVTYVVNASPKWELKHHEWWFPVVGKMPYKGFFNEQDAKEEEEDLKKQDLDTYLRGVSAYSTLGWFNDPILSSMLTSNDYDLVNTIIHETVHATLYRASSEFSSIFALRA
jgi:predicted aminopeptidase